MRIPTTIKLLVIITLFGFRISDFGFSPALAQTTLDPLALAVGARALGMGRAAVAVPGDGDVIFNNPAGLGEIDQLKATSMSGNLLDDLHYLSLGGVYPLGKQCAIGVGYAGAFVSAIPLLDGDKNPIGSGKANFGNNVGLLAIGKKLGEFTSIGLAFKYHLINGTEIDAGNGAGWNVNVGFLQGGLEWLTIGLVGENLLSSSQITYKSGVSEPLPARIKAGGNLYIAGSGYRAAKVAPVELRAAIDTYLDLSQTKPLSLHSGLEFSPNKYLTMRGGFDEGNLTAGVSLRIAGIGLHYAYHALGGFAENTAHFFSLTFDEHGWPVEEPPELYMTSR